MTVETSINGISIVFSQTKTVRIIAVQEWRNKMALDGVFLRHIKREL